MRHRTTILLLFAILLGAIPMYREYAAAGRCAEAHPSVSSEELNVASGPGLGQGAPCAEETAALEGWVHPLGVLSVLCFVGFAASLGLNLAARRREQQMLNRAGIPVEESDLPLEE